MADAALRRPRRSFARVLLMLATATAAVSAPLVGPARPAHAATLTQVSSFGSNPGNLAMFSYRPDGLPAGSPLVVAMHGCTQTANDYYTNAGWRKYADLWHFALVFPQQSSANNQNSCFNWFEPGDQNRGQGEALSIKQMVDFAVTNYGVDRRRVFVTGLSAGGAMTAVMLATYPDVFAAGSVIAGIAYKCGTDLNSGVLCLSQKQNKTPPQWGDLVRNAFSGFTGPWPRVSIWFGTSDTTVNPVNADELRDQWTNVWGISQTPTSSTSLPGNTTRSDYTSGGVPVVRVYKVTGIGHGTPVHPGTAIDQCGTATSFFLDSICSSYYIGRDWGLDGSASPPPSTLPAPTGLTVTGTTDSSASLSWSAVSGAAGYNVYRNGTKVAASTSTGVTDTGLSPGTTYSYAVAAVDSSGVEGARSGTVSATTTGTPPLCVFANNYEHVQAGRAHQNLGNVFANGSNDPMGLYNTFVTHTLKQTGTNFWVVADSGC